MITCDDYTRWMQKYSGELRQKGGKPWRYIVNDCEDGNNNKCKRGKPCEHLGTCEVCGVEICFYITLFNDEDEWLCPECGVKVGCVESNMMEVNSAENKSQ